MAWTEQCRIAFRTSVENMVHNHGKGVVEAITELSNDSDMPFGTLKRWYYEPEVFKKDIPKNGNSAVPGSDRPKCKKCQYRQVEKQSKTGKSHPSGLCTRCRKKERKLIKIQEAQAEWDQTPIDTEAEACWTELIEALNEVLDRDLSWGKVTKEVLVEILNFQRKFDTFVGLVMKPSFRPGG